ncbi:hypothetical protein C0J52_22843 [Blattella germanica]|nr:hypothetical protein C0J52_22843 [Blattella germanica]
MAKQKHTYIVYRFKLINNPTCPCQQGSQTVDHLIFECILLNTERNTPIREILRYENWPPRKNNFITKYCRKFSRFVNSIPFEKINNP